MNQNGQMYASPCYGGGGNICHSTLIIIEAV